MTELFRVKISADQSVTAMLYPSEEAHHAGVTLILGHGAGAGQTSNFIVDFAGGLATRGIDVVTFNFWYREQGRRIPDPNDKLEACYCAVIEAVRARMRSGRDALAIGGKSMGGRIASQAAASDVDDLAGLVFLGYRCTPQADLTGFAPRICRTSRRRCCSFRARATPSELPKSCARSLHRSSPRPRSTSSKAATTCLRFEKAPVLAKRIYTAQSRTV
jgi:pimeloyl-ACP methyl ester carboxylesterase